MHLAVLSMLCCCDSTGDCMYPNVFSSLQEKGLEAVPLLADGNLVDQAWGADRPELMAELLLLHGITCCSHTNA
jgi:hypothetical protein